MTGGQSDSGALALLLVAPALAMVAALFLYPLGFSLVSAVSVPGERV
mgnify:CR=1 FL=1